MIHLFFRQITEDISQKNAGTDYSEIFQHCKDGKELKIHLDSMKVMFIIALIKFCWDVLISPFICL